MRTIRLASATSAALLLATLAAGATPSTGSVRVAANERGDVAAIFQPFGSATRPLFGATREPGGSFGTPQRLRGTERNVLGSIAINGRGDVAVAWLEIGRRQDRIAVSVRRAGRRFARRRVLRTASRTRPRADSRFGTPIVVLNDARDMVAAFHQRPARGTPTLEVTRGTAATGRFGHATSVLTFIDRFSLALAGTGEAFLTWATFGDDAAVNVATAPPGADFGREQVIPTGGPELSPPEIRAGAAGEALVAWDAPNGVQTSFREPGATFADPVFHGDGLLETLAMNPSGQALLTFRDDGSDFATLISRGAPGTLERFPARRLATAIGAAGDAVMVWREGRRIIGRHRAAGAAAFSAPVTLYSSGRARSVSSPTVSMGPRGEAVVGWEARFPRSARVLVRAFAADGAGTIETVSTSPR